MRITAARASLAIPIFFLTLTLFTPAAPARVLYVNPTGIPDGTGARWETAFNTIAAGLTAAASGDEVWVRSATYNEAIDMKEGVALYGGFAGNEASRMERDWRSNETIVDATGRERLAVRATNNAILDGFTVRGGSTYYGSGVYCNESSPTLANCLITGNTSRYGGGVHCFRSSPTLINCLIVGNTADSDGGGIYCGQSSPTLTNCVIENNSAYSSGGGIHVNQGLLTLIDCRIEDNSARDGAGVYCQSFASPTLANCTVAANSARKNGGGLYCISSSPTLIECTIMGNSVRDSGSGLYCEGSSPILRNCAILENTASKNGGGILCSDSSPVLMNCAVAGNSASDGGGAYCLAPSSLELTNCTIVSNTAPNGSGIFSNKATPVLTNCILWNRGREIAGVDIDLAIIKYCAVQEGWPGEGNLAVSPRFTLWWDGYTIDIRLLSGSPCIDAGTEVPGLDMDFEGDPRPSGGGWDIGADECVGDCLPGDPSSSGSIWFVSSGAVGGDGRSWESPLSSISDALERAAIFDEIWIVGGTYMETITLEPDIPLYGGFAGGETERGQRNWIAHQTIIDASGLNSSVVLSDNISSATLDGLILRGGSAIYGGGMYCSQSSPTLANCVFKGNSAQLGGAIYCWTSAPRITNCVIMDNSARGAGSGIYCEKGSAPVIAYSTIVRNSSTDGFSCVASSQDSSLKITNCILWNRGSEISEYPSNPARITYCLIQGGWPGEGNLAANPGLIQIGDGDNTDLHLHSGSPCIDAGSDVLDVLTDFEGDPRPSGGGWDIGADECAGDCIPGEPSPGARIWYVDSAAEGGDGSSWESPLGHISEALDGATLSDELWIRSGTYREAIVLEPGVALYGGFAGDETSREERDWDANETIIDASGLARSVVICNEVLSATLDGLTITGGESWYGAGVHCQESFVTIENCTISGNSGGGGIYCNESDPLLINCKIIGNYGYSGGGIGCYDSSPKLNNCQISGNSASISGGGIYCSISSPVLLNCSIVGNTAGIGGAVRCFGHTPQLVNCTLLDNSSSQGVSIHSEGSYLTLTNCILWNIGNEVGGTYLDHVKASYCNIQGGWPGEGNFTRYPQLAQTWNGSSVDVHLVSGSPCIDAGTEVPGLFMDFEGDPRPSGGGWDIGADECVGACIPGDPSSSGRVWFVSSGAEGGNGSSWAAPLGSVGEGLKRASPLDEIWVRSATYEEAITLEPGVAIYGGFVGTETARKQRDWEANRTVIDGNGLDRCVVLCRTIPSATMDGFALTGGRGGVICQDSSPTFANCAITRNSEVDFGGGVFCTNSSPRLASCTLADNSATSGAGLYCIDGSSPELIECTIAGNWADQKGGGIYCENASPTFVGCSIIDNRATPFDYYGANHGGGVYLRNSSSSFRNCTIEGNLSGDEGGGIYCEGASPTLTACIIKRNEAYKGGGILDNGSSMAMTDCTIAENSYSGIYSAGSTSTLTNCTIEGNFAIESGGGIYFEYSNPRLIGCAITGNEAWNNGGGLCIEWNSSPVITGCTISSNMAGEACGGGVFVYQCSPQITSCSILGNSVVGYDGYGGGVCCYYASPKLVNCIIAGNSVKRQRLFGSQGGGVCGSHSSPELINCTIVENSAESGGGIYITDENLPIVVTDYFKQETEGSSLDIDLPVVTNCILWNMGYEIEGIGLEEVQVTFSTVQGGWPGEGNLAANPGLTQWWDGNSIDVRLLSGSPCIDAGTEVSGVDMDFEGDARPAGDGWDIGADECVGGCVPGDPSPGPRIWYVDSEAEGGDGSGWVTPLTFITEALDRSSPQDEIWVRSGIYREAIGMELGVGLYGGFSGNETKREQRDWNVHKTVIDASGRESSVVTCNSIPSATLDGFVLTGGVSSDGGGVYCYETSAVFANCTIEDNSAESSGGGVYCERAFSKLIQCSIAANIAERGGGVACRYSSPILRTCTVARNTTLLTPSYLSGLGGGLYCYDSSPILYGCLIADNNTEYDGGGLYSSWSSPSLFNCTIANNTADRDGNGLYFHTRSYPTLANCILRNAGDEIVGDSTPRTSAIYSCLSGGWPGEGNIDADPMFLRPWDGTSADLRLRPESPCIDAGTSVASLITDLAGNPRPVDIPGVGREGEGAIDMGAYERQVPDVGDIRGTAFFNYSVFWQRSESASPPAIDETEFNIYNTWLDDRIDWRDIFTALEIKR